jgi:hypothetical protein
MNLMEMEWQTTLVLLPPSTLSLLRQRESPLLSLCSSSVLQAILPSA